MSQPSAEKKTPAFNGAGATPLKRAQLSAITLWDRVGNR